MSVWQAEARHGGDDPGEERDDQQPRLTDPPPRARFTGRVSMPTPISPMVPPLFPPGVHMPVPPDVHRPVPAVPPTHPPARVDPSLIDPGRSTRSPSDGQITKYGAGERSGTKEVEERHYLATFGWTAAWYTVPFAIFAAWSLTFPADPGTACARPTGGTCLSPRTTALINLLDGLPRVAVALVIALLVAALIRWGSAAWRPVTVGFSAAVIGAGMATVLYSVLNSTG